MLPSLCSDYQVSVSIATKRLQHQLIEHKMFAWRMTVKILQHLTDIDRDGS